MPACMCRVCAICFVVLFTKRGLVRDPIESTVRGDIRFVLLGECLSSSDIWLRRNEDPLLLLRWWPTEPLAPANKSTPRPMDGRRPPMEPRRPPTEPRRPAPKGVSPPLIIETISLSTEEKRSRWLSGGISETSPSFDQSTLLSTGPSFRVGSSFFRKAINTSNGGVWSSSWSTSAPMSWICSGCASITNLNVRSPSLALSRSNSLSSEGYGARPERSLKHVSNRLNMLRLNG
mmetsp:Transcript_3786/g.7653  ORF Transcript_3786/g.7653 Transcript_3786/m.7653 type:complete len:233 (+) Transcript_3786:7762-8460(+)